MAELKTKPTTKSVDAFLNKITDEQRRSDCFAIVDMMRDATKEEPIMWGPSIVGFGRYHYKYDSGREADWMLVGFSPRKTDLTLYLMPGAETFPDLLSRLGKYKTGKSCLYLKRLADVDQRVLKKLITESVKKMAKQRIR